MTFCNWVLRRTGLVSAAATLAIVAVSAIGAGTAQATFSIAAADSSSKQVGSAFASCTAFLGDDNIQSKIYTAVPGVGAINGQAFYFSNQKDDLGQLLEKGSSPKQALAALIDANQTHPSPSSPLYESLGGFLGNDLLQRRQYLLASTDRRQAPAGFTGNNSTSLGAPQPAFNTAVRNFENFRAAIGGNTLTSQAVVRAMRSDFRHPAKIVALIEQLTGEDIPAGKEASVRAGNPLAQVLFVSLASGAKTGGDNRCSSQGKSSDQSYLRIDGPDGQVKMNLKYRDATGIDAVKMLARRYLRCTAYGENCIDV